MWSYYNICALLVGIYSDTVTVENGVTAQKINNNQIQTNHQKVKHRIIIEFAIPLLGIKTK